MALHRPLGHDFGSALRGLSASEIAALFEYDPRIVRCWINHYNEYVVGPDYRDQVEAPVSVAVGDGLAYDRPATGPRTPETRARAWLAARNMKP